MIKIRIGKKMKGSAVVILDDDSNMLLLLRSEKSRLFNPALSCEIVSDLNFV